MKRLLTRTVLGLLLGMMPAVALALPQVVRAAPLAPAAVPLAPAAAPLVPIAAPLVLVSFDYPPYVELHPGQAATGMMVDLVTAIFSRMGQPVDLQFYPLARSLSLLDTSRVDGFFTIKKTAEREQKYRFPREPLLIQDIVIFVRADSRFGFQGDLSELANVRLGVVNQVSYGAMFDAAASRGLFKQLELAQTYEANFRKLLAGRMDALVSSRTMGAAVLKRLNALQKAKVSGPPIDTTQSYLIFNRHTVSPEIAAAFDQTLSAMRKDGSLRRIRDQYTK